MSPEQRFDIKPYFKQSYRSQKGQVRDGFVLVDALTGYNKHFDLKREAVEYRERLLVDEQRIDWANIHAYDWRHDRRPRPCVEIYAYDEQGTRISVNGRAPMTLVGYDRDSNVVEAYLKLWLDEMGQAGLAKLSEIVAMRAAAAEARERQLIELKSETGPRGRRSGLAERTAPALSNAAV